MRQSLKAIAELLDVGGFKVVVVIGSRAPGNGKKLRALISRADISIRVGGVNRLVDALVLVAEDDEEAVLLEKTYFGQVGEGCIAFYLDENSSAGA